MNYFEAVEYLEPKCPKCGVILDYGTNTEFNEEMMAHVCLMCGNPLK